MSFWQFYEGPFTREHQHPFTVATHVFGTVLALAFVPVMVAWGVWFCVVLFPVVHGLPGILGHRLVERNAAVGDLRVTRTDYPILWFILANHVLTFELLTGRLRGRRG